MNFQSSVVAFVRSALFEPSKSSVESGLKRLGKFKIWKSFFVDIVGLQDFSSHDYTSSYYSYNSRSFKLNFQICRICQILFSIEFSWATQNLTDRQNPLKLILLFHLHASILQILGKRAECFLQNLQNIPNL